LKVGPKDLAHRLEVGVAADDRRLDPHRNGGYEECCLCRCRMNSDNAWAIAGDFFFFPVIL